VDKNTEILQLHPNRPDIKAGIPYPNNHTLGTYNSMDYNKFPY